jgi:hypothetical protein
MPLVDDLKTFERMGFMLLPKHRTITANSLTTSVAIVVQGRIMQRAVLLLLSEYGMVLGLQGIDGSGYLLNKTTID